MVPKSKHRERVAPARLGFLWIAYLGFANFNEARQGKAKWAEAGVPGIVGAIVMIFASYLLTEAARLFYYIYFVLIIHFIYNRIHIYG